MNTAQSHQLTTPRPPDHDTLAALQTQVAALTQAVAHFAALTSPWVRADEMAKRYGVTIQTLAAMEARGEIPQRTKGKWLRSELLIWEQSK